MRLSHVLDAIRAVARPGGRVLQAGTPGALTSALLTEGFDVRAVRTASAGGADARLFPSRVITASPNRLPFADGVFATVVANGVWLETLVDETLAAALAELGRVGGDALILTLTGTDRGPDQTAAPRTREWWEARLFEMGWRRHTRFFAAIDFEMLEDEPADACLIMQRIAPAIAEKHPLRVLRAERDLHMDMLRETGRRSDAHLARYEWARGWIKPGDVVVDAACGLGYGAAMIWDASEAARVVGIDISPSVIAYAQDCFARDRPGLEYSVANAETWDGWPDHSVDCIVSFETVEHLEHPDRFIAGARRVLRPGGRFLCSIPNEWLDETGKDPNPFHLHVFNLDRLVETVSAALLVDEAYAQSAGGHAKRFAPRRVLRNAGWPDTNRAIADGAEWWLLSAVKDPIGEAAVRYAEQVFPAAAPVPNAIAFGRDYDNPWLVHTVVMGPFRVRSPRLLRSLATRWLETSRPDSADTGAALCVLAYRALEDDAALDLSLLDRMAGYRARSSANPQVQRWQISLAFVEGLWRMRRGDFAAAESCLTWCATANATSFSPHLETKTTEAAWLSGRLALERGDAEAASACWKDAFRGLERLRQRSADDWLITPERPAAFEVGDGLREIALAIDAAVLSANGLRSVTDPSGQWRPGARPVYRNLRQNLNRFVDIIHSRGGDIVTLRAEFQAMYESWRTSQDALGREQFELQQTRGLLAESAADLTETQALLAEAIAERDRGRVQLDETAAETGRVRALLDDSRERLAQTNAEREREQYLLADAYHERDLRNIQALHAENAVAGLTGQLNQTQADLRRIAAERAALGGVLRRLMPRVVILGAGQDGRRVWEALARRGTADVVAIVDEDRRLHGRPFLDTVIRPPAWLDARDFDLVATAGRLSRELRARLKQLGVAADSIITFPVRKDDATLNRLAAQWFPDPLAPLPGRSARSAVRVGIFGTGAAAMKVWEALADIDSADAVWFADNNTAQQGKSLLWLDILAPDRILASNADAIVVGSMSIDPIRKQLLGLGVRGTQILTPNVAAPVGLIRQELAVSLGAFEDAFK